KSIDDFTAGHAEIEIHLPPEQDTDRAMETLFAFTQCQVQVSGRMIVIRKNKPVEMDVASILRHNTSHLVGILRRELQRRRRRLLEDMHHKTLVRLFVENRVYKSIENCASPAEAQEAVLQGLLPFRSELQRDITHEDVESLLAIAIRRISLFDLEKNRRELEQLSNELIEVDQDLSAIVPYTVRYLRTLLRKHGAEYPRRTSVTAFGEISERELTAEELTLRYDREKGYIGHKVVGEDLILCSPLDRILLVWKDGRCKVVPPPEKLFVDTTIIYCAILDRERVLTVVYDLDFFTYYKKFMVGGLITNRESRLAPRGTSIRFFTDANPSILYVRYAADARIKIRQQKFNVERQPLRGRDAKGLILTANLIEYVGSDKAADWDDALTGPPGKFLDS
ncbi:MAG: gyrA 2, partial [Acidobacteria bacterium]|nr:gyrA 2 [Acidobacteriota bacterium]